MSWSHRDGTWPTPGLSHGGDYNPEQWSRDVWREDISLMRRAKVTMVSLGIFSWGLVETGDGEYDWEWFDEIFGMLEEAGIGIDLATPSAAPPGWLLAKHPEMWPVDADGRVHGPGARLGWCPSNADFRYHATRIARALADRYGRRDAVRMWHVGNEFGGGNARCHCPVSAEAFRGWLREKYGSLEHLNAAWGSAVWGHTYRSWDHVHPPRSFDALNPSAVLDFDRFSSDELLAHYLAERAVLKEITPDLPVTTNFMVGAEPDVVDYARWAPHMDIVANDHYTRSSDIDPEQDVAFSGDRMRALTTDRRPWLLMEHSTSAVSWQPRNRPKRAGELLRDSLSHIAHGADGAMFFQWRASKGGTEQFHSAMVPHAGADTEVFRDVCRLGEAFERLAPVLGSRTTQGRVALLFDDDAGWAMSKGVKPHNELAYGRLARDWHAAFYRRGVSTEIVPPWHALEGYSVVVVSSLFLVDDVAADSVRRYAEAGGHVVVTFLSGIVDAENQIRLGGYPGAFRDLLGAWTEEFVPLMSGERFALDNGWSGQDWTERVRLNGAEVTARYAGGALDGAPALTRRGLPGGGSASYVSCRLEGAALDAYVAELPVEPERPDLPAAVEYAERIGAEEMFSFYINHGGDAVVAARGTEMLADSDLSDGWLRLPAGSVRVTRSPHSAIDH